MRPDLALPLALALFAGAAQAKEMTFAFVGNGGNCLGCEWVVGQGEITEDTPAAFQAFVAENGGGAVALDSPGGDAAAAMALGRAIRAAGWGTDRRGTGLEDDMSHETSECVSACVLAFMGGVNRSADPDFDLTLVGGDGWLDAERLRYVLDMGISAEVLLAGVALAPGERRVITVGEAARWGLTNGVTRTDPWRLEPWKDGLVLTTVQRRGATYELPVTLSCRSDGSGWHILMTEPGDFTQAVFPNPDIFAAGESGGAEFVMGAARYRLGEGDIDFVDQSATGLTVSLRVPADLAAHAGQAMRFQPGLGRVYAGIFEVAVPLPAEPWLRLAAANCI